MYSYVLIHKANPRVYLRALIWKILLSCFVTTLRSTLITTSSCAVNTISAENSTDPFFSKFRNLRFSGLMPRKYSRWENAEKRTASLIQKLLCPSQNILLIFRPHWHFLNHCRDWLTHRSFAPVRIYKSDSAKSK